MTPPRSPARLPQDRRARADGFTLVELLVTITIIAVLAALGIVVTQRVRERTRIVNAISALRQVASFHMAYSSENQGSINTSGGILVGRAVTSAPELFAAAIYFVACFAMSRYSRWLEQHLNTGTRRQ